MSPSKAVSTLTYLINFGISSDLYYDKGKTGLKSAKAYWDEDHNLIFEINGERHKFVYSGKFKD